MSFFNHSSGANFRSRISKLKSVYPLDSDQYEDLRKSESGYTYPIQHQIGKIVYLGWSLHGHVFALVGCSPSALHSAVTGRPLASSLLLNNLKLLLT